MRLCWKLNVMIELCSSEDIMWFVIKVCCVVVMVLHCFESYL